VGLALALGWLGMATLGLNVVRIGGFALSDGIFFLLGSVLVIKLLLGDDGDLAPARARGASQLIMGGSIILLTAGVLATFFSWGPGTSLLVVVRLGYVTLVWFWMLQAITSSRRALDVLLSGWRAGVMVVASLAVLGQMGVVHLGYENSENRQMVYYGHPNDLAGYLLVAVPLVVLSLPRRPDQTALRRNVVRIVLVALLGYAITTTGSITGLFGASVGVATAYGLPLLFPVGRQQRRRQHPLTILAGVGVALIGILLVAWSDLPVVDRIERLDQGDSGVESSVNSREQTNQVVIDSFDKRLVFGVGLDQESVLAASGGGGKFQIGAHNMYLKVLYESGLPGLIGLLIILGATFRAAVMLLRNTRSTSLYPVVLALTASTVSACVFAMFQPTLYHRFFWLPLALLWCCWHLRRQELRELQAAAAAEGPGRDPGGGPPAAAGLSAPPGPVAALPPAGGSNNGRSGNGSASNRRTRGI
jgi:O-antigen ligase